MPSPTSLQRPYIATRELTAVDPKRGTFTIRVSIGQPYQTDTGEWACPVGLEGLHQSLRDMHGEDAFQALMLAQNLARQLLGHFVEGGGALLDAPGGSAVSVQRLFDSGVMADGI